MPAAIGILSTRHWLGLVVVLERKVQPAGDLCEEGRVKAGQEGVREGAEGSGGWDTEDGAHWAVTQSHDRTN